MYVVIPHMAKVLYCFQQSDHITLGQSPKKAFCSRILMNIYGMRHALVCWLISLY